MTTQELYRFFSKVKFDLVKGCWLWTASLAGNGQYACFRAGGRTRGGHIVSFEHWRGFVPEGRELDHIECDTRRCVNPWHVEPVTHKQNVHRGRGLAAVNRQKTHCKHGHLLAGDNLWIQSKTGYRYCRTCAKARLEVFAAKRRVNLTNY